MKRMKRLQVTAAASVALALVLAGCGTSGSSAQSSATTTAATSAAASSAESPASSAQSSAESPASSAESPASSAQSSVESSAATDTSGSGAGSTAASGSYPAGPGSLTVGSADFPENEILMNLYGDAMAAKGVTVTKKPNVGERPAYLAALGDGSIDLVPEYSGSILAYLKPDTKVSTSEDVYKELQTAVTGDLTVLPYAEAQDSDTITVTKATADKYKLTSIADLVPVAGQLTFGAPAGFKTRNDGIPALKSKYGVTFGTFTALAAGGAVTVTALKNQTIDAADVFSTDPAIKANGFVSLTDPKNMFAAQNVIPLANKTKLTQPMVDAAAAVSAQLNTADLADMVSQVAGGKDPDAVAKAWLSAKGLG